MLPAPSVFPALLAFTQDLPPRPVLIDWPHLLKQCVAVLAHSSLPPYMLLPEVRALLATVKHANHYLLLSTL